MSRDNPFSQLQRVRRSPFEHNVWDNGVVAGGQRRAAGGDRGADTSPGANQSSCPNYNPPPPHAHPSKNDPFLCLVFIINALFLQDENWGETTTAVTNVSELDYAMEDLSKWQIDNQRSFQFRWGFIKEPSSHQDASYTCIVGILCQNI